MVNSTLIFYHSQRSKKAITSPQGIKGISRAAHHQNEIRLNTLSDAAASGLRYFADNRRSSAIGLHPGLGREAAGAGQTEDGNRPDAGAAGAADATPS